MKKPELTLCGIGAVKARFESDPASFIRLFFDEANGRRLGPLCKALAAARKVYRCVPPEELAKIAGSLHHGGVVAIVEPARLAAPAPRDIAGWAARRTPLVVLDRIGNPHNLGAIVRTAAFFGIADIIIPAHPDAALPNDAAHRVAEGGMELVRVWRTSDLPALLRALAAAGYDVVGAATRGGDPETTAASLAATRKPLALVLGNEESGLSPPVTKACTKLVTIQGHGGVESLNVSVAGAILLHALGLRGAPTRKVSPNHG
ncbi:MAG: RNA methyltransferase [Verrucomicrobiota bacterium]